DVNHLQEPVGTRVKFKDSSHTLSALTFEHKSLNDPSKHEDHRACPEYSRVHQSRKILQEAD
ncbi:MAG TPA: hypothetical protein DD648_07105, partial [Candidatus Omnitrophica bacterium]|nr:hypothetical protein [Candidatus Omnitrophota bacterium]